MKRKALIICISSFLIISLFGLLIIAGNVPCARTSIRNSTSLINAKNAQSFDPKVEQHADGNTSENPGDNTKPNFPNYDKYLEDRENAEAIKRKVINSGETTLDRLYGEFISLSEGGVPKNELRKWLNEAWRETGRLCDSLQLQDVQISLSDDLMIHRSSILEGVSSYFDAREGSSAMVSDLVRSRGFLIGLLAEFDRPQFDEELRVAIENQNVDGIVTILGVLFSPVVIQKIGNGDHGIIEKMIGSGRFAPCLVSLGLIEYFVAIDAELGADAREVNLKALYEMINNRNDFLAVELMQIQETLLIELERQLQEFK